MQIWAWMKHCARFYRMVISQESDGFSDSPILTSSLGYNTSPITARVWIVHFAQDVLLRVGGYNHTHVHSRIICSWMWNQPQTAGVYTRSQCECSCLESAVITAIRVAPTSSKVRAAITSPRSSTLSALFSSNLLLTEWLADKWRFLFFAWGLHRVGQRRRRTLQRNVGKLLLAFFFPPAVASCTIYTWVSHSFHSRKGEKTEFTQKEECVGEEGYEGAKRCDEMFRMSGQKVKAEKKKVTMSLQQSVFSRATILFYWWGTGFIYLTQSSMNHSPKRIRFCSHWVSCPECGRIHGHVRTSSKFNW